MKYKKLTQIEIDQIHRVLKINNVIPRKHGFTHIYQCIMNEYQISRDVLEQIIKGSYIPKITSNEHATVLIEFPDYTIDRNGVIYGKSGKALKLHSNERGYLFVRLCMNGNVTKKRVHRLVADTFIPNFHNLPEINHIDGNKSNNTISNLEWCTRKQNMEHAAKILKVMNWKQDSKQKVYGLTRSRKISDCDLHDIMRQLNEVSHMKGKWGYGSKLTKIANQYNVHPQTIRNISNNKIPCYKNSHIEAKYPL